MKRYLVSLALFLAFDTSAIAACSSFGCDSKIHRLYPTALPGGVVFIEMTDSANGIANCTLAQDKFFSLKKTHELFDENYAMLLTATIAKSNVRVRIKEGTPDCEVSYVWILGS